MRNSMLFSTGYLANYLYRAVFLRRQLLPIVAATHVNITRRQAEYITKITTGEHRVSKFNGENTVNGYSTNIT